MAKRENAKSIIGENSFFEGRFYISGELQVDGKFEGTSLFIDTLNVTKKGKVKSDIKANHAIVEGIIVGNITANSRVALLPSAKVLGDITTTELIIQHGVMMEGKCTISSDMEQSPREIIEKLYNEKA